MEALQNQLAEIEKSFLAFDSNIFKVYQNQLVSKEIEGKIRTKDVRAYKIEEILEPQLQEAFEYFESDVNIDHSNYSLNIDIEFNPKSGYYFKVEVSNSATDFESYTTVQITGKRVPAIVADFKISIDTLIEECEENEKECADYSHNDYYPAY